MPEIKTLRRIRDLVFEAASAAGSLKYGLLSRVLEMALLELEQIVKERDQTSLNIIQRGEAGKNLQLIEYDRPPKVIGSWEWDIQNKVVYADPEVAKIYNVDPKAAESGIAESLFGIAIYPEDLPTIGMAVKQAIEDGGGFNVVYRLVQADKSIKWVFAIGRVVFESGVAVRFPGTIIDVTTDERRKLRAMQYNNRAV